MKLPPKIIAEDYVNMGPSDYRMDHRQTLTRVAKGKGEPSVVFMGRTYPSDIEWLRMIGAGSYWTN